ncbi:MAG: beta-galactosidase, partial [Erysipelotrichaceae bacterium]
LPLHHVYGLFNRSYFWLYLNELESYANEFGMKVPFVVNVHGFDQRDYAKRGLRYPIGLSQLRDTMYNQNAILAGDYYIGNLVLENFTDVIMADALTTSLQRPEQPLFSAEFQGGFQTDYPVLQPTSIDLNSRLCIADGMNGINYYMFVGGYNFHDSGLLGKIHDWQAPIDIKGNYRPSYHAIKALGHCVSALGQDFINSKTHVDVTIGWDPDMYMTEYWVAATKPMQDRLSRIREVGLFGIGRNLSLNNITYDALDLYGNESIQSSIKKLIIVGCPWMNAWLQEKLVKYVQDGGNLVLINEVPTMDYYGNPCLILSDVLDLKHKGDEHWGFASYNVWDSINFMEMHLYEHENGFFESAKTKETAGFIKEVGKGKLLMLGILLDNERLFKAEVWASLLAKLDIKSKYVVNDRVYLSERRSANTTYLSVLNLDEYRKVLNIKRQGKALFDGHPLILQSRQGVILPLKLTLDNGVILEYSTVEMVKVEKDTLTFSISAKDAWIRFNHISKITVSHPHDLIQEGHAVIVHLKNQDEQIVTISTGGLQ